MKLFSKLKDYNNLLEEILDLKTFSSIAKSLYLSMIYKLEISYKDYSIVNKNCISKDKFLSNILDIIKNYCDNVKIVEPDSSQAMILSTHKVNAVTNTKERSIMSYPTEIAMLYSISDIEPKYFYINKDFMFKNIFQKVLVYGYKLNTINILKNFNGWSWDIDKNQKIDYTANIIYQNIMMIIGEEFLYEWRKDNTAKKDYLTELKRSVKKVTGNDNYYLSLCKILYKISGKNEKAKIKNKLRIKELQYKEFCVQSDEFQKEHVREFNKLKNYHNIFESSKTEYEELVELQKFFLKYLEKKIEKANTKSEIINIIYNLRLYQNIPFFEGVYVSEYSEIKSVLEKTIKKAIIKACKLNVLKVISLDDETNFEIFKYILDTKIINLEEIKISIEIEENNIFIKVYDKEVFEKQGKIQFSGNKKDIAIKRKRMINIFN